MDTHLLAFIRQYAVVVLSTLMLVMAVAFLSIPFSLGGHPGEVDTAQARNARGAQGAPPALISPTLATSESFTPAPA